MTRLITLLTKLYITNIKLNGINHQTEVVFGINEIKEILEFERLTTDKFMENYQKDVERFGIKTTKINDDYINFKMGKNIKLSSRELIESYNDVINLIESECKYTGNYSKLNIDI